MATENNAAPGQEDAPEEGKTVYRPDQADGDQIIEGAQQDDQLQKEEQNAAEEPADHHLGASPDKDVLSTEDITAGIKTVGEENRLHNALETPEGKNNGAAPAAYAGQQTNQP